MASGREQRAQLGRDADDLGGAFVDRAPGDAETGGELVAELGLVEVAGGAGLPEERTAMQRAPQAVVATGQVRDEHMGVELRIPGPARAVHEPRGDEAVTGDMLDAVDTSPGQARLAFEPAERGVDGPVVRGAHRADRVGITETEQHGHGLRCREREIETRDPVFAGLDQPGPVDRAPAFEHRTQVGRVDLALEAEQHGRGAHPPARCFAVAEVVVLDTLGDRVEVVALLAGAELADTQHGSSQRVDATGGAVSCIDDASVCQKFRVVIRGGNAAKVG